LLFDVIAFDRWMALTGTSNQSAASQLGVPRVALLPIVEAFVRERNEEILSAISIEVVHRNVKVHY